MNFEKVNWQNLNSSLKNKLIKNAEGKDPLDFLFFPDKKTYVVVEKNNFIRSLGCHICLSDDKGQDDFGYITLNGITLINYKDLIVDNILPVSDLCSLEISTNVWMCPNCNRWILDYIPKYDTIPVRSYECQPSN